MKFLDPKVLYTPRFLYVEDFDFTQIGWEDLNDEYQLTSSYEFYGSPMTEILYICREALIFSMRINGEFAVKL